MMMTRQHLLCTLIFLSTSSTVVAWLPPLNRQSNRSTLARTADKVSDKSFAIQDSAKTNLRQIQGAIASVAFGLHVLCSPILAPPANAAATTVDTITTAAPTIPTNLGNLQDVVLEGTQRVKEPTVIDEAWTLVDKYYIDRTFGGQDWQKVKQKYDNLIVKTQGDKSREVQLLSSMISSLRDRYSRILDPQQYAAIQKYDLIGVGATLMPNEDKQIIVGAPPIAGSAADKAGLKVGDVVAAVNGMPTFGRTAFDIIDQIADVPNAKQVTMTIRSADRAKKNDSSQDRNVVLDRQTQEIKNPIKYKMSEVRSDGTKVGFIRILEFNSQVKANLEEALEKLNKAGANAYVIDLRKNTGGAFQSAVEITGLFVQDRVATYVVDAANVELPFRTPKDRLAIDASIPIVVWMDGTTASASEVLAGSLHDNCRAVLMGEKSFGKGLIQAVYGLKNGAGLVLTVARYVTPGGTEIQGIGLTPDIPGANIVPLALPGIGTDTSKIDFTDIRNRLSSKYCKLPTEVR